MTKLMKVWLSKEDGAFIEIDLPTHPAYIQNAIDLLLAGRNNCNVYISDYEYLVPNLSYEDGEQMDLVNQFISVFELNQILNNIMDSEDPDKAIALLIADMIRKEDLNNVDDINYFLQRFEPIKLDKDIFNYNPRYDDEYYWIILDAVKPELSGLLSSENAECYFDVKKFVEDTVLGDATVTSTGYLVCHF